MHEIEIDLPDVILDFLEGWREEKKAERDEIIASLDRFDDRKTVKAHEDYKKSLETGSYKELLQRYLQSQEAEWRSVKKFDVDEAIRINKEQALGLTEKGKGFLIQQLIWHIITYRTESIRFVDSTIGLAKELEK